MSIDTVNRAVSQAANKVREAKASLPPPPPAPAAAPATTSSKSQVQSAFEGAAKAKPVNLTGESAPTTQTVAQASSNSFRYVQGTTGLTTTSTAGAPKAANVSEAAGPGFSHSQSIEETEGFGIGYEFEASTSKVVTKPGENGPEGKVKLEVSGSVYAYVEAEAEKGPVTVSGKAMQGVKTTYEVELTEQQYNDWVRNGSNPASLPNPFPGTNVPPGASIQLKSESYHSEEVEVAYKNIKANTSTSESTGVSMGVERLTPENPPKVRISAGPTQAVERTMGLGVGTDNFGVTLTGERGLESYQLQTATLDLSTDEGKAAYNTFLLTGQVPQKDGPGVEGAARETKMSYTDALNAGLIVGDHEFSVNLSNVEQEVKVTETENTRKIEYGYFSTGDEGMSSVRSQNFYRDDSGQWAQAPGGETQVSYANVSPRDAAKLQEIFTGQPGDPKASGRYNTQFTLSDDQANMLAQRARKYSKDMGLGNGEADVFIRQLSEARTPQEVQAAFNKARGNTASVEALWVLYNHSMDPMPLGNGYQQVKR